MTATYGHAWLLAQQCTGDPECRRTAVIVNNDGTLVCFFHCPEETMGTTRPVTP